MQKIKINLKVLSFLLSFFISSCTVKYTETGKTETISEKKKISSYSVYEVSEPTSSDPNLLLKVEAKGAIIKEIKQEFQKKTEIKPLLPVLTSVTGLGLGYFLNSIGYSALGRDIGILGIGYLGSSLAYNLFLSKPVKFWKEKEIEIPETFVPDEEFAIKLGGTEYTTYISPDNKGNLRISMLEFAPFYKENSPFYIRLFSQKGEDLAEFKINTEPLKRLLLKGKNP